MPRSLSNGVIRCNHHIHDQGCHHCSQVVAVASYLLEQQSRHHRLVTSSSQ